LSKKQKNLLKLWAKESSVQLMGDLTGGKGERILCTGECMVKKKVLIHLTADGRLNREWPKILVLCLSVFIGLKNKVLKDLNLRKGE
jgi:hypothetical protein